MCVCVCVVCVCCVCVCIEVHWTYIGHYIWTWPGMMNWMTKTVQLSKTCLKNLKKRWASHKDSKDSEIRELSLHTCKVKNAVSVFWKISHQIKIITSWCFGSQIMFFAIFWWCYWIYYGLISTRDSLYKMNFFKWRKNNYILILLSISLFSSYDISSVTTGFSAGKSK